MLHLVYENKRNYKSIKKKDLNIIIVKAVYQIRGANN